MTHALAQSIPFAHSAPSWEQSQKQAWQQFETKGFPTRRDEEWKYTSVKDLAQSDWLVPQSPHAEKTQELTLPEDLQIFLWPFESRLVFINGFFQETLSNVPHVSGLSVQSLRSLLDNNNLAALEPFSQLKTSENAFSNLNRAFATNGVVLSLEPQTVVESPLHILSIFDESVSHDLSFDSESACALINPKHFVHMGHHSEMTLIETSVSFSDKRYLTNTAIDILLEPSAVLHHNILQEESKAGSHISNTRVQQKKASQYRHFHIDLGASLARHQKDVTLLEPEASVSLDGLYALKGQQHADHHTVIDHLCPHAQSRQLYKGLLDDQAHAVFNGKIFVRPQAQKTDSSQLNQNLLLSRKAQIDTKPQLEISADDVSCTHGATVGQIREEDLFYFESRCISKEQARRLLIEGFAQEALDEISKPAVRSFFSARLKERYLKDQGEQS